VVEGADQGFTIVPAAGFAVTALEVDGSPLPAGEAFTFTDVAADHSIHAAFADVAPPTVTLIAPNGGEQWQQVAAQTLAWSALDNAGVTAIDLDYSLTGAGGPWLEIVHGLTDDGPYDWAVPSAVSDSAVVRVTAYDAADNAASDLSDSLFSIGFDLVAVDGPAGPLALAAPVPNPGHGATSLRFVLPQAGRATLEIVDASGRRVWRTQEDLPAGTHARHWDGTTAAGSRAQAGLYFVRLVTPLGTRTVRLAWLP
jgi:hypothetical protein